MVKSVFRMRYTKFCDIYCFVVVNVVVPVFATVAVIVVVVIANVIVVVDVSVLFFALEHHWQQLSTTFAHLKYGRLFGDFILMPGNFVLSVTDGA